MGRKHLRQSNYGALTCEGNEMARRHRRCGDECRFWVGELEHAGLAPAVNSRSPLWPGVLTSLFSYPQRCPGVLLCSSRLSHGIHPLRRRNRRTCLLASHPCTDYGHRTTLDTAFSLLSEPNHLSAYRYHCCSVSICGKETDARES